MQQNQILTNPNAHLLDDSVKAPLMNNERRSRKIENINESHSNTEGEQSNVQNVQESPMEQAVNYNTTNSTVSQTKTTTEEKRFLGMKPKTAIIVGVSLLVVGGVVFYFYKKSKKKIPIELIS